MIFICRFFEYIGQNSYKGDSLLESFKKPGPAKWLGVGRGLAVNLTSWVQSRGPRGGRSEPD